MEDCIFCKIAKGEIPSQKVFENDNIIAFNDINPVAPIHVLIIPKKHIDNLLDIKEEDKEVINEIFQVAIPEIAKKLGVEQNGFRLIANCGKDAGQEVMHLHFHFIGGEKLGTKII